MRCLQRPQPLGHSMQKNTEQPLYAQLVNKLITYMEEKEYGDRLPSERELCNIYNMSRTTVRQAMYELELGGYITKVHGKGTFVAKPAGEKNDLSHYYSFTTRTLEQNKTPKVEILDFHLETANKSLLKGLGLREGEKVFRFDRLRLADDIPMMLETTFIPKDISPDLHKELLMETPLYEILERQNHQSIKKVVEHLSAGNLSPKQAQALNLQAGLACLKITRYSYNAQGRVLELTHSFARADLFVYTAVTTR